MIIGIGVLITCWVGLFITCRIIWKWFLQVRTFPNILKKGFIYFYSSRVSIKRNDFGLVSEISKNPNLIVLVVKFFFPSRELNYKYIKHSKFYTTKALTFVFTKKTKRKNFQRWPLRKKNSFLLSKKKKKIL